jgi:hypothetical protein
MAKPAAKPIRMELSSGNVLADLGIPDAAELDTKVQLAVEINPPHCLSKNVTGRGRCLTGDVTGDGIRHHAASTTSERAWAPR